LNHRMAAPFVSAAVILAPKEGQRHGVREERGVFGGRGSEGKCDCGKAVRSGIGGSGKERRKYACPFNKKSGFLSNWNRSWGDFARLKEGGASVLWWRINATNFCFLLRVFFALGREMILHVILSFLSSLFKIIIESKFIESKFSTNLSR